MRDILFSFLKFLQQELPGVVIHRIFNSSINASASLLKEDALNINVLNFTTTNHKADVVVALDVIYNEENTAINIVELLSKALRKTNTELRDFTNSAAPVVVSNKNIFWNPPAFRRISTDQHCRFNCNFTIECYERERT